MRVAAVILSFFVASMLAAQLKVDVALVNVVATITDENGRYVADLSPDDLIVEEDGLPQTIAHFDQSRDVPVSLGIVLDTSFSMDPKIATATAAADRFIRSIHEDDDVFLMPFSYYPYVLQDFTSDRAVLTKALRRVQISGDTALYDALVEGLRKIRDGKHQKRAILLISDGDDTASRNSFESAALAVRESEVLVYSLGIAPDGMAPVEPPQVRGMPQSIDMKVLNALTATSGGKAWLVSGKPENRLIEIQAAFDEIAAELRNQYSIGYYATHALSDGQWHRIQIRPKNPQHRVRSRRDYFGGSEDCTYLPFFSPCVPVFPQPPL